MILVTGGAGYIGSHTVKHLIKSGYGVIAYDNLSAGHRDFVTEAVLIEGDIGDSQKLDRVFHDYKIDAVIHFAASAYVGESVTNPAKYYGNNVCNTFSLLESMRRNDVKKIIFSSSCATYGIPKTLPITESTPQNPISPYGTTKHIVEKILKDYKNAYGFRFVALRYFNAAGADMDGNIGEWHTPETHVIPLILQSVIESKPFNVFGNDYKTKDGTCIRDYIHVDDLADAHVRAIDYLSKKGDKIEFFNVGTGRGVSIGELANAVNDVTGKKVMLKYCARREGDPAELVASNDLIGSEFGWQPKFSSIENIVSTAWNWQQKLNYPRCV